MLRGGHRFYGAPFHVDGLSWLKIEKTDVSPPVFSPGGTSRRCVPGDPKAFYESIPPLYHKAEILLEAPEVWIRNEASCISFVRAARSLKKSTSAPDLCAVKELRQTVNTNRSQELEQLSFSVQKMSSCRPLPPLNNEDWAAAGGGGWVNFRKFGVHGGPPNTNCGRWRQFQGDN